MTNDERAKLRKKRNLFRRRQLPPNHRERVGLPTTPRPRVTKGERYGMLTVIAPNYFHITECLVLCDCGKEAVANVQLMIDGHKKSCGCLQGRHRKTPTA